MARRLRRIARFASDCLCFDFSFFAVAAVSIYFGGEMPAFLAAAAVHEAGHAAALLLFGGGIARMRFGAAGIYMTPRRGRALSFFEEAAVLLCGPLAGIISAAVLRGISQGYFEISLLLSILNLLPVKGLDGGSVLRLVCFDMSGGGQSILNAAGYISIAAIGLYSLIPLSFGGKINAAALMLALALLIRHLTDREE